MLLCGILLALGCSGCLSTPTATLCLCLLRSLLWKMKQKDRRHHLCASKTFMFYLLTVKGWGLSVMFAAESMLMKCPFCGIHWNAYSYEVSRIFLFLEHFLLIASAAITRLKLRNKAEFVNGMASGTIMHYYVTYGVVKPEPIHCNSHGTSSGNISFEQS